MRSNASNVIACNSVRLRPVFDGALLVFWVQTDVIYYIQSMQNKKQRIRNIRLRKLLKIHTVLTSVFLGVYFLAAFFDPGFLSYDLRQKYNALADDTLVITATVLGSPAQPVVTATAECNSVTGVLSIALNWVDDANTYTYDIDRNSLPLVTGLTASEYTDLNVTVATTYEYIVTANGPMGPGFAESVPVSVTTPAGCTVTATAPQVSILSFGGRGVDSYDGMPRVNDRRPVFSGTTNMSNAIIQVVIGSANGFAAEFFANANGYWEWKPPSELNSGNQTFTVTAIDPSDVARQAMASLKFGIKKKDDKIGESSKQEVSIIPTPEEGIAQSDRELPIRFSFSVENDNRTVRQGEALKLFLLIKHLAKRYHNTNIPFRFSIVNDEGNAVVSVTNEELLSKEREIWKLLEMPMYIAAGQYIVRTEVLFDNVNVSREDSVLITELPLIRLGGEASITYAEIMRNLGWITLILLVLLLLWLFMFIREYWMYLQALRHITERQFIKAGFLAKRKGVIR